VFQPDHGHRYYLGISGPLFSDTGFTGLESEIADFAGRKTGFCIPCWIADRLSERAGVWGMKEKPVLRIPVFMNPELGGNSEILLD
jgi:hypothetical protein